MTKAIKVEGLSKAYQLGQFSTGTLSRDLERWWALLRGKEDPFLKVGETNDRLKKGTSDFVWSLRDISFEVEQGDAVGIIGRNGAGKSTLLKVLSQVTSPTSGLVKVRGRIASLLEVGTGFHPELTGRENIFLNGAILGMRKSEIKRKFDEIVSFAGVERYIDTPVKRYSSGMYVRLAFAVAAHLDSEILIVDEVLAVGDAEFQKKCLGKMGEVSAAEGRTVLFVSHNMTSISSLCNKSVLLKNGEVHLTGNTADVISTYLNSNLAIPYQKIWSKEEAPGNEVVRLLMVRPIDSNKEPVSIVDITQPFGIEIEYSVEKDGHTLWHSLEFYNEEGVRIFDSHNVTSSMYSEPHLCGRFKTIAWLPPNFFNEGKFIINVAIFNHAKHAIYVYEKEVIAFDVHDFLREDVLSSRGKSVGRFPGLLRPLLTWENHT